MVVKIRIISVFLLIFLCIDLIGLVMRGSIKSYSPTTTRNIAGFVEQPDWFSPALVDANGDRFLDVVKAVISPPNALGYLEAYDLVHQKVLWRIISTWCSPPVLYDLDGDGVVEIVVIGNGTEIWSVDSSSGGIEWGLSVDDIFKFSRPAIYDVDSDGSVEIIVCGAYSTYIIDVRNLSLDYVFEDTYMDFLSPAIGDINVDSIPEILLQFYDKEWDEFVLKAVSLGRNPYILWEIKDLMLRACLLYTSPSPRDRG